MEDLNIRKTWGDVHAGDTIYFVTTHKATTRINKHTVQKVKHFNERSVDVGVLAGGYFCAYSDETSEYEANTFGKCVVTTTLEEAKEECKEIVNNRIKDIKNEISVLKKTLKKWEEHKSLLDDELYNIK